MNRAAGNGLFLARHFQNAYVTQDIDAVAERFKERHGIASFQFMRDIPFGPGASIHIGHIALACALGYLDLRMEGRWRETYPKLVSWLDDFASRVPAFETTRMKS